MKKKNSEVDVTDRDFWYGFGIGIIANVIGSFIWDKIDKAKKKKEEEKIMVNG
jgi:hypothetical protein